MLHPVKLRVILKGTETEFTDPRKACKFPKLHFGTGKEDTEDALMTMLQMLGVIRTWW